MAAIQSVITHLQGLNFDPGSDLPRQHSQCSVNASNNNNKENNENIQTNNCNDVPRIPSSAPATTEDKENTANTFSVPEYTNDLSRTSTTGSESSNSTVKRYEIEQEPAVDIPTLDVNSTNNDTKTNNNESDNDSDTTADGNLETDNDHYNNHAYNVDGQLDTRRRDSSITPEDTITPSTPALLAELQKVEDQQSNCQPRDIYSKELETEDDHFCLDNSTETLQSKPSGPAVNAPVTLVPSTSIPSSSSSIPAPAPLASSASVPTPMSQHSRRATLESVDLPSVEERPEPTTPAENPSHSRSHSNLHSYPLSHSRHHYTNSQTDSVALQPSAIGSSDPPLFSGVPHSISQPQISIGSKRHTSQSSQTHIRSLSQNTPSSIQSQVQLQATASVAASTASSQQQQQMHYGFPPPGSINASVGISNNSQTSSICGQSTHNYSFQDLVDLDIKSQAVQIGVQQAHLRMLHTTVHANIMYRLCAAIDGFFSTATLRQNHDTTKFASAFQNVIDTSNYLLKDECAIRSAPFSLSLKGHHRRLVESFVTLVKTAPTFVAAALLSMSASDMENFIDGSSFSSSPSSEVYPDVTVLIRTRPLDLLFFTFFPTDVALTQREEYFAQLMLPLITHKRGDNICFAVLDKFMDQEGHTYCKGLELQLLQILQDGSSVIKHDASNKLGDKVDSDGLRSNPISPRPQSPLLSTSETKPTSSVSASSKPLMRRRARTAVGAFPISTNAQGEEDSQLTAIVNKGVESILQFIAMPYNSIIPASILRVLKYVVNKLDTERRRGAILFFMVRYFFGRHITRVITHPERIGMLDKFYISDQARAKLLTAVAQKIQLCVTLFASGADLGNEIIHTHLSAIYSIFEGATMTSAGPSLSNDSENVWGGGETFASPGQVVVVAPSDMVCLYTALFPSFALHQRSSSMNASHHNNMANRNARPSVTSYSTSSSISSSTPGRDCKPPPHYVHENSHVHGHVDSQDETTMLYGPNELDSDESISPHTYSPASPGSPFGPTEDSEWSLEDIKSDLQPVMEELIRRYPYLRHKELGQILYSLRPAKTQAFRVPHPLSEKWQVYRMGEDGTMHEFDYEYFNSMAASTFNECESKRSSVFISDDYIPVPSAYRTQLGIVKGAVERLVAARGTTSLSDSFAGSDNFQWSSAQQLTQLLSSSTQTSAINGNFVASHEYANALACLKRIYTAPGVDAVGVNAHVFSSIARAKEEKVDLAEQQLNDATEKTRPYKLEIVRLRNKCQEIIERIGQFRIKVWYATEVRTSSVWKRARDVSQALTYGNDYVRQNMSVPHRPAAMNSSSIRAQGAPQLRRNSSTSSIASLAEFTFKRLTRRDSAKRHSMVNIGNDRPTNPSTAHSGVGDSGSTNVCTNLLMFAPRELAGKFKLNDKESAATTKWLEGQQVQNFCNGEERIHRFCCEIDDLLKRIMGDALSARKNRGQSMLSGSALFRSDLWSCILELEGASRGSSMHANLKRASMIDITAEALSRNNHHHNKGHRSSMSNVLDVFGSLDTTDYVAAAAASSSTVSKPLLLSTAGFAHRRNASDAGTASANIWDDNIENQSDPSGSGLETKAQNSLEAEELRQKLEQMLLDVQMTLIGLLYTDLGAACFDEGKFLFVIVFSFYDIFTNQEAKLINGCVQQ